MLMLMLIWRRLLRDADDGQMKMWHTRKISRGRQEDCVRASINQEERKQELNAIVVWFGCT